MPTRRICLSNSQQSDGGNRCRYSKDCHTSCQSFIRCKIIWLSLSKFCSNERSQTITISHNQYSDYRKHVPSGSKTNRDRNAKTNGIIYRSQTIVLSFHRRNQIIFSTQCIDNYKYCRNEDRRLYLSKKNRNKKLTKQTEAFKV